MHSESSNQIIIQTAKLEDITTILSLSSLGFDYDFQFDQTLNMNWVNSSEAMNHYKKLITNHNSTIIIALSNSKAIGYLSATVEMPEDYRKQFKIAEIIELIVVEEFRSKNIGSRLISEFRTWAKQKNCERTRVQVSAQNEKAIRFYCKNHFEDYITILEGEI